MRALRAVAREPLVHFLALGMLIFAINAAITPSVDKQKLIEVTSAQRQDIIDRFKATNQREPTVAELTSLLNAVVFNEVLYREGLAQGIDKGDEMIRERLIQKMRVLMFSNVTQRAPTDAELSAWLEQHRSRFDTPATISFFDVPIEGAGARARADQLIAQIRAGTEPDEVHNRARGFASRPEPSIDVVFGEGFLAKLKALPRGEWSVVEAADGVHIVRVDGTTPVVPAKLEEIRDRLDADWRQEQVRAQALAQIRELARNYKIEGATP